MLPGGNNLSGWLRLQGTPEGEEDVWGKASLVSQELDANQQPVISQVVETAAEGAFEFIDLPDGIYDLIVRRGGYLDREIKDIVIANNLPVDLDRILLLTGDLSRDNWVDRGDLQLMRDAYGTQGDMESFDWIADLNNDNQVSILDLALMMRNYARKGAGGPYVWKPDAWYYAALGQVVLKATPMADIYYTIGTQEAPPANPNRFDPTQLYVKGTGIVMGEGQVLKMIAVEPYWGGTSPVVIMTYEEILNH